jgi:molybdopterin-guanine dinucleotide biosynthesis protein A
MAIVAARRSHAAIPRIDGRPEPVCGAYGRSALAAITEALDAGRLKTADAIADLDVTWLEGLDPALFRSLNTPDDLDRFHAEFASQR